MRKFAALIAVFAAPALTVATPVLAQDRGEAAPSARAMPRDERAVTRRSDFSEQQRAFRLKESGRALALPVLKNRIDRMMPEADFIGAEYRGDRYRLKYMEDGRVIWVDVDSRTGRVVDSSR